MTFRFEFDIIISEIQNLDLKFEGRKDELKMVEYVNENLLADEINKELAEKEWIEEDF